MEILNVSAECFPVAKVGGLADVVGALPKYQKKLGVESKVIMPFYDNDFKKNNKFKVVNTGYLKLGKLRYEYEILRPIIPLDFTILLVDIPGLFDRSDVYSYEDDVERFLAFQFAIEIRHFIFSCLILWQHSIDIKLSTE